MRKRFTQVIKYASVAQSVEQRIRNAQVVSSSLTGSSRKTLIGRFPKLFMRQGISLIAFSAKTLYAPYKLLPNKGKTLDILKYFPYNSIRGE